MTQVLRFEGRLLYPFAFELRTLKAAVLALTSSSVLAEGRWALSGPSPLYSDELHPHVADFLFSEGDSGCAYLALDPGVAEKWLRHVVVPLSDKEAAEIKRGRPGIELFLSHFGVGVLSIGVTLVSERTPATVTGLLYSLAQLHKRKASTLRVPHPSEDPDSKAEKSRLAPAPEAGAPLVGRIGHRGGTFTLEEVLDALLAPIADLKPVRMQGELSAYAVVGLGADVDFATTDKREDFAQLLSGLAQLEEVTHAGVSLDSLSVPNAVLNRRHWAAASTLASAHLLADQPPPAGRDEHPFNAERSYRVLYKYFAAFVIAMLQRLILERLLEDAGALVSGQPAAGRAELARLRTKLLEFAIRGYFTQVSSRGAVQRYYHMVQEAMNLPATHASVQQAVAELDARYTSENAARLFEAQTEILQVNTRLVSDAARSQRTLVRMQRDVELLEMFVVAFYFVHFESILFEHLDGARWQFRALLVTGPIVFFGVRWLLRRHHGHSELR